MKSWREFQTVGPATEKARRPPVRPAAGPPACRQCYRRQTTTTPTDASEQNNTGPLGAPVIKVIRVDVLLMVLIGIKV